MSRGVTSAEVEARLSPLKGDPLAVRLNVVIPGPVVPQGRPRFARGRVVSPKGTRAYRRHVESCIAVELMRSWPVGRREACKDASLRWGIAILIAWPDARRRDLDNAAKMLLDAANGYLFRDDSQVDYLEVTRLPPDKGNPRALLSAWVL